MTAEVSLADRETAYAVAENDAMEAAVRYFDARVSGVGVIESGHALDEAQAELRRAKRRLEDTERRLEKQADTTGGEG